MRANSDNDSLDFFRDERRDQPRSAPGGRLTILLNGTSTGRVVSDYKRGIRNYGFRILARKLSTLGRTRCTSLAGTVGSGSQSTRDYQHQTASTVEKWIDIKNIK